MAIWLACPKCGKKITIQNDYAGKKWKCIGCKNKIIIPDPAINRLGKVRCRCGGNIITWDIYLEEGVLCTACGQVSERKPREEKVGHIAQMRERVREENKAGSEARDEEVEYLPERRVLPDRRKAATEREHERRVRDRRGHERLDLQPVAPYRKGSKKEKIVLTLVIALIHFAVFIILLFIVAKIRSAGPVSGSDFIGYATSLGNIIDTFIVFVIVAGIFDAFYWKFIYKRRFEKYLESRNRR